LHQNVWQRVSGLYTDPLGSPQEMRIDGGREVASGLDPQDLRQIVTIATSLRLGRVT